MKSLGVTALATVALELQSEAFKYATEAKIYWDSWNRYIILAGFTVAIFRGAQHWVRNGKLRGIVKTAKSEYEQLDMLHQTAHSRAIEKGVI